MLNGCGGSSVSGQTSVDLNLSDNDENGSEVICAEVVTHAYNPETGEERDFPTPCDVPAGWVLSPVDSVSPIIELKGAQTITITAKTSFVDPGAEAYDEQDGNLTDKIIRSGEVDTLHSGTYQLTYRVSDTSGNEADPVYRYVIVTPITQSHQYESNASLNLINPDRGFYDASYGLEKERDYNAYEAAYNEGYRLVYAPIDLSDYNETQTLPDSLLSTIEKNLQDAQTAHMGLILRIKYRDSIDSSDPEKALILSHLDQLTPLLQQYTHTISVVQAGLIGAWGEWHSFSGDFEEGTEGYIENRRELVEKLSAIFPQTYLQIRTPMHKELLFGESESYGEVGDAGMITPQTAYSTQLQSRVGHHNDCFLINQTDAGTYMSDNIDFWRAYVANDTQYAPMGGETCGIGDGDDAQLSDCPNTLAQLKTLHFSFINDAYHPDVIDKWKDQGCYEEIAQNLGYRLEATQLELSYDDADLDIRFSFENKGYAAPYRNASVSFLLMNDTDRYLLPLTEDIRKWYGQEAQEIAYHVDLDPIKKGTYCLYFKIETDGGSIALANSRTWVESVEANLLECGIDVH